MDFVAFLSILYSSGRPIGLDVSSDRGLPQVVGSSVYLPVCTCTCSYVYIYTCTCMRYLVV